MRSADQHLNIAHWLPELAASQAGKRAVVVSVGRDVLGNLTSAHLTFAELNARCDRFAWALQDIGIRRGMLSLLMVRPGLDFVPAVFALFKLGAVPVLIDPGMGWRNLLAAIRHVQPQAFIGIPLAHALRHLAPGAFRSVQYPVTLGRNVFFGGHPLTTRAAQAPAAPYPLADTTADETAAVLFTTGSTGPAKGVVYTHRIFDAQVRFIQREYGIRPDDVDLPCFPLFALFSVCMGVTAIIPEMDFTRPAKADPRHIVEAVGHHGVTYSFGSPALWAPVSRYCVEQGIRLPGLKQVFMAGAPVAGEIHQRLLGHVLAPGAQTHTPYGATEALPVASHKGSDALAETDALTRTGHGICVGRPVPEVTVRIIRVEEEPIPAWSEALCLPPGEIGEIAVKGDIVTPAYYGLERATRLAKIPDPAGGVWHRMGDVGYLDRQGRLWFCGRKAHRVLTATGQLYTIPCEAIFRAHPDVARAALVGIGAHGNQTPVVVIEPTPEKWRRAVADRRRFETELLALAAASPLTTGVRHLLFHREFPVDIRHNAKIRREDLAAWAKTQIGKVPADLPKSKPSTMVNIR